jgi:hypothetical protein
MRWTISSARRSRGENPIRTAMATDRTAVLSVPVAAALLLWPALWNGYPIVFADTGTYLSQAIHQYAGWDRPVFYSLFMLPLHGTVTTWPVAGVQALLTAWVLRLVCGVLVPGLSAWIFVAGVAVLSLCTWLPWIVCELMPDVFTPLLVLVLCVLAVVPERISWRERGVLVALASFMIASQQSSLPLACGLLGVLALLRGVGDGGAGHGLDQHGPAAAMPGLFCSMLRPAEPLSPHLPPDTAIVAPLGTATPRLSWPGLAQPSTTYGAGRGKVVGGRAKPGHDDEDGHDNRDGHDDGDGRGNEDGHDNEADITMVAAGKTVPASPPGQRG